MQFLCRITTLQNWPHAVIHGVEKRWIWQPFRGYDETQKKGLHHSWVVFALCAGAESFWNILFWFPKCCQTQGSTTDSKMMRWYTPLSILTPCSTKIRGTNSTPGYEGLRILMVFQNGRWNRILYRPAPIVLSIVCSFYSEQFLMFEETEKLTTFLHSHPLVFIC